jgi:hypothetical protein
VGAVHGGGHDLGVGGEGGVFPDLPAGEAGFFEQAGRRDCRGRLEVTPEGVEGEYGSGEGRGRTL